MSHFTRIKTRMVEKEFLLKALQDLGYECEHGDLKIGGFAFQRTPVEIKVKTRGYDVGFRRAGEVYELVGDWWGVRGLDRKTFLQQLTQRYAYHAALSKLEAQGFALVSEEVEESERLHLVLRRMV